MASPPPPPAPSSSVSAVPPPPPADIAPSPSSPLPPSKRRWTPCTWRYAIEDAQPELSSRSRPSTPSPSPPPSSFPSRSRPHIHPHPLPASHTHHHRDRPRRLHGSRLGLVGYARPDNRFKDTSSEQQRVRPDKNHHDQLHPSKDESDPSTADGDEEDGGEEGGGRRHSDAATERGEQNLKRRKREMSPSELYFCKICAAAGDAATVASSMGTDACLQDS